MRILITNAYSWYNKGDAAIVLGMIDSLRRYFPSASVVVVTQTPEIDRVKYKGHNFQIIGDIFNTMALSELSGKRNIRTSESHPRNANSFRRLRNLRAIRGLKSALKLFFFAFLMKHLKVELKRLLNVDEMRFLNEYIRSDVVISCGGGFLNDYSIASLLNNLAEITLSTMLDKPTILYAQTIGPFRRQILAVITARALEKVDMILVRESISKEMLREMEVTKPAVFVVADAAFTLGPIDKNSARTLLTSEGVNLNDRPIVGMTVRRWFFPRDPNPSEKQAYYLQIISRTIDFLIEKLHATVVFLPQVMVHEEDDDRVVAQKICSMVRYPERVRNITTDFSPEELKGIIGELDLFIGTRMHSNIFALTMQVPTIAISYEHKTNGIMRMLDLERFTMPIDKLNFSELAARVEEAWKIRDELKASLVQKTALLQKQALLGAKLVKDYLKARMEHSV